MFHGQHPLLCGSPLHTLPHARQSPVSGWLMRKVLLLICCSLLLPVLCRPQVATKLAPEVRAFVKEDAAVIALAHVRVIDGTGASPRADQTLVIREGKIAALGDAASTKIPEGAKVLDLSGRTITVSYTHLTLPTICSV